MRAFLALEIRSSEVLAKIQAAQRRLLETGADLKLVDPSKLHFTLRFFGEISQDQADSIYRRVEGMPGNAVETRFKNVGVFPNPRRISVIWIGVNEESGVQMIAMADEIEKRLGGVVQREDRRFKPHLTISRVRTGRNRTELQEALQELSGIEFGTETIRELKLKKSELTPQGPVYTDLFGIPLSEKN